MTREDWEAWMLQHNYRVPRFEIGDVVRCPDGQMCEVIDRTNAGSTGWIYLLTDRPDYLKERQLEMASAVDRLGGLA